MIEKIIGDTNKMKLVDTHCHLWRQEISGNTWLSPELGILWRTYSPADLADAAGETGTYACVLVEAGKTSEENRELQRMSESSSLIQAFISYVDLESPALAKELDIWQEDSKFRGIRMGFEGNSDHDILKHPGIIDGLKEIARRELIFEFLVQTPNLKDVITIYEQIPELKGIIEHLGKPNMTDKNDFTEWKEQIAVLAGNTNVNCKLSFSPRAQNMGALLANPGQGLSPDLIKPYVDFLIEHFGSDRLMWGSDWPICLLFGEYGEIWEVFDGIISDIKREDKTNIFGYNAIRFYSLNCKEE